MTVKPHLASPPPPPPRRGPSPLLFLGLILGTGGLFAYTLQRKSQQTTATSTRLRASGPIQPGWLGDQDQERVQDPEVALLLKKREAREAKEAKEKTRIGAVGGTEGLAGGWETVRSPGVQPRHTMPPEFRGEVRRGQEVEEPSHQERERRLV